MPAKFIFTQASIQFKYNETVNLELPFAPRDDLTTAENNGAPNLVQTALYPWVRGSTANPTMYCRNSFFGGAANGTGPGGLGDEFNPAMFFGWHPNFSDTTLGIETDPANRENQFNFFAFGDITGYGPNGDPAFGYSYVALIIQKFRVNRYRGDVWCNKIAVNIPPVDGSPDWSNFSGLAMAWGSILAVCHKL